jgi:phage-related protein
MGFFDNVSSFFKGAWKKVTSTVSSAAGAVVSGAKSIYQDAKAAIPVVYNDIKSGIQSYGATITHLIDKGADVVKGSIDKVGDTVSNLGQSLSMPLLLVGGAAALYFLRK